MILAEREQLILKGWHALDRNENLDPTFRSLIQLDLVSLCPSTCSVYPDYPQFQNKLAKHFKVSENELLLTCGASEAIKIVFDCFFNFGRLGNALVLSPTYQGAIEYLSKTAAAVHTLPAQTSMASLLEYVKNHQIDCVYLCNPNNPTGTYYTQEDLNQIRESPAIFFIDESYYEFCGVSALDLPMRPWNILVTRSFSKAWGLAGLRLGVLIGDKETIRLLSDNKLRASVGTVGVRVLSKLLDHTDWVKDSVVNIKKGDSYMRALLNSRGYSIYNDPNVNFLWTDVPSSVLNQLKVLHKVVDDKTCITLAPKDQLQDIFEDGLPRK